jgi:hypothetical protein
VTFLKELLLSHVAAWKQFSLSQWFPHRVSQTLVENEPKKKMMAKEEGKGR